MAGLRKSEGDLRGFSHSSHGIGFGTVWAGGLELDAIAALHPWAKATTAKAVRVHDSLPVASSSPQILTVKFQAYSQFSAQ